MSLAKTALVMALGGVAMLAAPAYAQSKSTLDTIKQRGTLRCSAHNGSFSGFAEVDAQGKWKGFDISFCQALAAAILGDPDKVAFVPVSFAQRFPALQSGDVDVLFKVVGWTLSRDVKQKLDFTMPYFMGAFQFMVPTSSKVRGGKDMNGATICTAAGTTAEPAIADYAAAQGIKVQIVTFEKTEEMLAAYTGGRCDIYGGWGPSVSITRATKIANPTAHTVLPLNLNMEPNSAVVREGDKAMRDVVTWTVAATIRAEELGISSANVDEIKVKAEKNPGQFPEAARLLGVTKGSASAMGLNDNWAYNVIKRVGNYGEIFDRTLGKNTPYKMERGLNRLWKDGGLLYSPVFD